MSQASLLSTFVGLGALLCAVWWLADRATSSDRSVVARDPGPAFERSVELQPTESPAALRGVQRTALQAESSASAAAEPLAPANLTGRLQVDGFAPYHGRVRIEADDAWRHTAVIDPYGRFYVENVPPSKLSLSFEMEWHAERQLLLPTVLTTPEPGKTEVVDLDWRTRQVDVRVRNGDEAPGPVRVDMRGPSYLASFETNELGKARLSLVGSGSFSFRAALPAGLQGEAEVELYEGDELETVLITTAPVPAR